MQRVDAVVFHKTLWNILKENGGSATFHSNDFNHSIQLSKQHFDYIVGARINHNQFIHNGIVFNLVRDAELI